MVSIRVRIVFPFIVTNWPLWPSCTHTLLTSEGVRNVRNLGLQQYNMAYFCTHFKATQQSQSTFNTIKLAHDITGLLPQSSNTLLNYYTFKFVYSLGNISEQLT